MQHIELYIIFVAIYLDEHDCILVMLPPPWEYYSLRQRCLAAGIEIHQSERRNGKWKQTKKTKKNRKRKNELLGMFGAFPYRHYTEG